MPNHFNQLPEGRYCEMMPTHSETVVKKKDEHTLGKISAVLAVSDSHFSQKANTFLNNPENNDNSAIKIATKLGNLATLEGNHLMSAYLHSLAVTELLHNAKGTDELKVKLLYTLVEKIFFAAESSPGAVRVLMETLTTLHSYQDIPEVYTHIAYFPEPYRILSQVLTLLEQVDESSKDELIHYVIKWSEFSNTTNDIYWDDRYDELIKLIAVYKKNPKAGISMLADMIAHDTSYQTMDWIEFVEDLMANGVDAYVIDIAWTTLECLKELYLDSPMLDILSLFLQRNAMMLDRVDLKSNLRSTTEQLDGKKSISLMSQRDELIREVDALDIRLENKKVDMLMLLLNSKVDENIKYGVVSIVQKWHINKVMDLPKEFFYNELDAVSHAEDLRKLEGFLLKMGYVQDEYGDLKPSSDNSNSNESV